jgi:hypothetical protein
MPYEQHPVFGTVQNSQTIWRYKGFSDFLWMLYYNKLHFHQVADFSDPFEGTLPKALHQIRNNEIRSMKEDEGIEHDMVSDHKRAIEFGRETAYANCWHAKNSESAAMWDIYSKHDQPIAIKSNVSRLIDAVESIDTNVYIGKIVYIDYYSDRENLSASTVEELNRLYGRTEHSNLYYPILLKRKEFEHEHELRVVVSDMEDNPTHKNMGADFGRLIDEVYINPSASDRFIETVQNAVEDSKIPISDDQVCPSDMSKEPWH